MKTGCGLDVIQGYPGRTGRERVLVWGGGMAAMLTVWLLLSVSAAAQNLLVNPDAESGNISGWTDPDAAWVAAAEITPHGGSNFFWPKLKDLPLTTMYQDVSVSSHAAQIDAGHAYLHLAGWLANWDQYPHDQATLGVQALNTSTQQLLYLARSHRSPVWTRYAMDGQIPAGTRILRVLLTATRFVGSDNDGYFDDLSLTVDTNAPVVFVTIQAAGGQIALPVGGTLQLAANTTGGVDSNYIWSSSFPAIATVNSNGLVSATQAGRFFILAEGGSTHAVGSYELSAYTSNSVVVTQPATGVEWTSGSTQAITWVMIGTVSTGMLFHSTNGGGAWTAIGPVPNVSVGHYDWTIPATAVALNNCLVRMAWNTGQSASGIFSIVPPTAPAVTLDGIERTVAGVTLRWHGNKTGLVYAVETRTNLIAGNWALATPTAQWWTAGTVWTNPAVLKTQETYRVRAK